MTAAIEIATLGVCFGDRTVVSDVSITVELGEVHVLLGPNCAGKTTTVETLLGFRSPTTGTVRLLGRDPWREHDVVVAQVGALLQRGGVWFPMTPRQVLQLTATYYRAPRSGEELVERLALSKCATTPWRRLSGGEQQRTLLALALLGHPDVLILDEPTSAVDPEGHLVVRQIINEERERGCAVLITTHQLNDAEALGDRITVLDDGSVVASGTLSELSGEPVLLIECSTELDAAELSRRLGSPVASEGPRLYRCAVVNSPENVSIVTNYLGELNARLISLRSRDSLEEIYLRLMAPGNEGGQP